MADRKWNSISHLGPVARSYLEAYRELNEDFLSVCGEALSPNETHIWATALSEAWELEKLLRSISPLGYNLTWFDTDDLMRDLK